MAELLLYLFLLMLPQNVHLQGDESAFRVTKVPTSWKKIFSYNNYYRYPVTRNSQWSTGLKTQTSGRVLVSTQSLAQEISVGTRFQIYSLEFSYMEDIDPRIVIQPIYIQKERMEMDEIYRQVGHTSVVTIPARTLLTKWQLVANVAGHEVGYNHTMDTYGNTVPHIHIRSDSTNDEEYGYGHEQNVDHDHEGDSGHNHNHNHNHHHGHNHNHNHNHHHDHGQLGQRHHYGHHHNDLSRAAIGVHSQPPILYEKTRIRIIHMDTKQYLAVASTRSRMSPATLSSSIDFEFILYNSRSGIRVRTLNPGYRGYEWLTSDARGQIHFTRSSRSLTQYWDVNDATDLYDGAVVTFRNNGNGRDFLRYYNGQLMTGGTGDQWHLEAA